MTHKVNKPNPLEFCKCNLSVTNGQCATCITPVIPFIVVLLRYFTPVTKQKNDLLPPTFYKMLDVLLKTLVNEYISQNADLLLSLLLHITITLKQL